MTLPPRVQAFTSAPVAVSRRQQQRAARPASRQLVRAAAEEEDPKLSFKSNNRVGAAWGGEAGRGGKGHATPHTTCASAPIRRCLGTRAAEAAGASSRSQAGCPGGQGECCARACAQLAPRFCAPHCCADAHARCPQALGYTAEDSAGQSNIFSVEVSCSLGWGAVQRGCAGCLRLGRDRSPAWLGRVVRNRRSRCKKEPWNMDGTVLIVDATSPAGGVVH